jgi:hypothetical protein
MKKLLHSNIFYVFLGAVFGFLFIVLPPYLFKDEIIREYDSPLFPFISTALSNISIVPTAMSLFLLGCLLGYVKPRIWWFLGISIVFLFPIASIIDIIFYPKSHNLFPFEMMVYGMIDLPAFVGAFVGFLLKRLTTKK